MSLFGPQNIMNSVKSDGVYVVLEKINNDKIKVVCVCRNKADAVRKSKLNQFVDGPIPFFDDKEIYIDPDINPWSHPPPICPHPKYPKPPLHFDPPVRPDNPFVPFD